MIFCSPQCVDVYGEVKDWIEPKAKPEEWNPLAEPSMMMAPAQLPDDDTPLKQEASVPPVAGLPEDESVLDATKLRAAAAPVEEPPLSADEAQLDVPVIAPARRRVHRGVWIGVAASLLVAVGILVIRPGKAKKEEPASSPVAKVEPSKPPFPVIGPPKPPSAVVEPPKPVAPKVEPPKPLPVVVEPAKPPPAVIEPPKPVAPKIEPPKPPPVVVEPAKPPPAVVEPPKPVAPKIEPPKPALPPVDVKKSLDRADAHVREAVPLFTEVLEELEAGGSGKAAMRGLLEKAERARRGLVEARKLYADVAPAAADPGIIEGRIRRIDTLLETTAGFVEQIKSRL